MAAPAPSPSKRTSTGSKRQSLAPRPPLTLSSRSIIAAHASIAGIHSVTIHPYAILNPYAKIVSVNAPVVVGEGCVIWEKGTVGIQDTSLDELSKISPNSGELVRQGVTLGRNVIVESMAIVEAVEIGDGTVVESGAKVGMGCVLGKYCTVTPGTVVPPFTKLPDFTVIMNDSRTRINTTLRDRKDILTTKDLNHERQLHSLRALIPNNLAKWQ